MNKDKIKKKLIHWLIPDDRLWVIAGNLAERFHDKTENEGAYDDLQEKFYWWIRQQIK